MQKTIARQISELQDLIVLVFFVGGVLLVSAVVVAVVGVLLSNFRVIVLAQSPWLPIVIGVLLMLAGGAIYGGREMTHRAARWQRRDTLRQTVLRGESPAVPVLATPQADAAALAPPPTIILRAKPAAKIGILVLLSILPGLLALIMLLTALITNTLEQIDAAIAYAQARTGQPVYDVPD